MQFTTPTLLHHSTMYYGTTYFYIYTVLLCYKTLSGTIWHFYPASLYQPLQLLVCLLQFAIGCFGQNPGLLMFVNHTAFNPQLTYTAHGGTPITIADAASASPHTTTLASVNGWITPTATPATPALVDRITYTATPATSALVDETFTYTATPTPGNGEVTHTATPTPPAPVDAEVTQTATPATTTPAKAARPQMIWFPVIQQPKCRLSLYPFPYLASL